MRQIVGVVIGVTTLVVGAVGGSSASSATATGSADSAGQPDSASSSSGPPWIPFESDDVTYAAGEGCDFEVSGEVLHDQEFFRTVAMYPDGSPRTQQFKGPLIMRFTNAETGESVERNAWGNAFERFRPDGSFESLTIEEGHFIGRIRAGNQPGPGVYYVTGSWSELVRNSDGTSSLFLGPDGTAENLCDTLAP